MGERCRSYSIVAEHVESQRKYASMNFSSFISQVKMLRASLLSFIYFIYLVLVTCNIHVILVCA